MGQVAQARVVTVPHLRAEAARAVTTRKTVAATKADMVTWAAAPLTTAITVVPAHARISADMVQVASRAAAARSTTAIVIRHTVATVTVTRKTISDNC